MKLFARIFAFNALLLVLAAAPFASTASAQDPGTGDAVEDGSGASVDGTGDAMPEVAPVVVVVESFPESSALIGAEAEATVSITLPLATEVAMIELDDSTVELIESTALSGGADQREVSYRVRFVAWRPGVHHIAVQVRIIDGLLHQS